MLRIASLTLASLLFAAGPVLAEIDLDVSLTLSGDVQITTSAYACGDEQTDVTVKYVNAAPNYFAIVPVDGEVLVMVNVISGSGAKYAAGQYEWWSKGAEATLYNLMDDPESPAGLLCVENVQTP